jgi:hypothetical protein
MTQAFSTITGRFIMTLTLILRALSSTLAALALSANGASAENRPIHPATVAPKVTNPPPAKPNSDGREQVFERYQFSNGAVTGYKTNHGTTGGAMEGRHRKQ